MDHRNIPLILIVDDNPFNRELIQTAVEAEGCRGLEAANGKEAIELISEHDFQLIFMDLLMPGMDGFETTAKIRHAGITCPIIAVSAINIKQDRQRCLDAGCNEMIPKPVGLEDLQNILHAYLNADRKDASQASSEPDALPSPESFAFGDYRVLLVEEDASVAEHYASRLKELGFMVDHVANGARAWEKIEHNSSCADIVISNIFTSGIDGLGLLNKLKHTYPHVLMIIYTPDYDSETFNAAVQQGVDAVIPQERFRESAPAMIASAITAAKTVGSRMNQAHRAEQIRHAQVRLIQRGCSEACPCIDMAHSSLHEAGGDIAQCRRFNRDGRCGIVLSDVAGHDIMSSYISAIFLGMLSSVWSTHQKPRELLHAINAELLNIRQTNRHVCMTAVLWDRRRRRVDIATAGNPAPLLLTPERGGGFSVTELNGGGMCLGLLKETGLFTYESFSLHEGSHLILFSDGISRQDIEGVLTGRPAMLHEAEPHCFSRMLLDAVLEKRRQADDMLVFTLHGSDAQSRDELRYEFLSSYEGVDRAHEWAASCITGRDVPLGHDRDFVLLAIREVLLNAVEHGNRMRPDSWVDLSIDKSGGGLVVRVSDEGAGFDLEKQARRIRDHDALNSDKRGLYIIDSTADCIDVDGGTIELHIQERRREAGE